MKVGKLLSLSIFYSFHFFQSSASDPASEEKIEELPKPAAIRSPYVDPRPSYDSMSAYETLRKGNSKGYSNRNIYLDDHEFEDRYDERLEERLKYLMRQKLQHAHQRESLDESDMIASPTVYENDIDRTSGYGGGYGLTCTTGYINASAVALLAFLFLLNIVQDVINQITGNNGRKRRDTFEMSALHKFIGDGGADAIYQNIPTKLLSLMEEISDLKHPRCIMKPLCEFNLDLSESYGVAGRIIATLVSNIASQVYTDARVEFYDAAQSAAAAGRGGSCGKIVSCSGNRKREWVDRISNYGKENII